MFEFDYLMDRLSAFSPSVIVPATAPPVAVWLGNGEASLSLEAPARLIRIVSGELSKEQFLKLRENVLFRIGAPESELRDISDTPTVVFPESTSAQQLYRQTAEALNEIGRLHKAKQAFFEVLEKRKKLNELLKTAEDVFGNPVAVYDISMQPICCGAGYLQLADAMFHYPGDELFARAKKYSEPLFLGSSDNVHVKRLVCRVMIDQIIVGYCVILETERLLTGLDQEIMRSLVSAIGIVLEGDNYLPYKNTEDGVILQDLYSGVIADRASLLRRTAPYQWTMHKYWLVINIFTGDRGRSALNISTIFLEYLAQMLPMIDCSVRFLIEKGRIIALLNMQGNDIAPHFAELDAFMKAENMTGTVSRRFTDIMEFRMHVDYTERLSEAALLSGMHRGFFEGDALFFQNVAFTLSKFSDLQNYCLGKLIELRQKDCEKGTDYFNTMRVYLECGQSATKCAKKMYLHRNTIIRRIEKFCQLTGFDLSGEDLFKLYFSYKLLEYEERASNAPHNKPNTRNMYGVLEK